MNSNPPATALGVVREKELGSIVNLYVTPVSKVEFLFGKQLPYVAVAMMNYLVMLAMAPTVFGVPVKDMPAEVRRRAKAINFGIIYGISGFGLANQLGIARVFQTPEIFPEMTCLENALIAGLAARDGAFAFNLLQHPRRLGEARDLADLRPLHAGHGVQVHAQLVGMLAVLCAHGMGMQLQAREVRHPGERRGVARNHFLGAAPRGEAQPHHLDPGRARGGRARRRNL